jgi:large subunit ribosomal protein L29
MKTKDLRDLSRAELREKEDELCCEIFDLRFKHGTRQLDDTAAVKRTRKDLARVLTIAKQKDLAEG